MIIGEGERVSDTAEIARLEMELSKARKEVCRLKKALDVMSVTNARLSAEISDLRANFGVSSDYINVDYEVSYEVLTD